MQCFLIVWDHLQLLVLIHVEGNVVHYIILAELRYDPVHALVLYVDIYLS